MPHRLVREPADDDDQGPNNNSPPAINHLDSATAPPLTETNGGEIPAAQHVTPLTQGSHGSTTTNGQLYDDDGQGPNGDSPSLTRSVAPSPSKSDGTDTQEAAHVTQPSSTFFYNGVSTDNFDDDYQQEYYRVDGLLFQDFSIPLPVSEDEKVLPELLASLLNVDPHCLDDNDRSDDSTDDLPEEIVLPAENFLLINLDDFNDFLKKFFKTRNYVRSHPLRRQWSRCKNCITQKWHVRYINSTVHLTTRNFVFVRCQIVVAFLLSPTNIQLGIQMHAFAAKLSGMDIQCRIKYSPSLAMQIPGVTIGFYDDSCRHQTPLTDVFQTSSTAKPLVPRKVLKNITPNYYRYYDNETVDADFKTLGLQLVVQE